MENQNILIWEDAYSVENEEIDNQHKIMFEIINTLIKSIQSNPTKEDVTDIINRLVEYKKEHFATEEKYFKQYNYVDSQKHIDAHSLFSENLQKLSIKYENDPVMLAYELVELLEDWLIDHILKMDHEYISCFKANI
jgi:hemerythrin